MAAGERRRTFTSDTLMTAAGLYFHHPTSLEHDPREHLAEHPDSPDRIVAVESAMALEDCLGFELRTAGAAKDDALLRVHTPRLIESLRELAARGGGRIDDDTFLGEPSWRAAVHAAGGACDMVRALVAGESRIGFAALRPSGHHADRDRAMGFCLLNNIAIAAELAIAELGVERVLILDWDVHHGNGTAEIFRHRHDVLFASIHQRGIYPGTGGLGDSGSGAGVGYTINLPVHAGADGELWLSLLEYVVIPAAREFAPDLVLISAGFDAHRLDPVGGCRLETEDFAQMACQVRELAGELDAPIGAVLEGGYHPRVLGECVVATLAALAGEGEAESIAPDQIYTPRAAAHVGRHWSLEA
jgi:acetoin utilization deacetylase AcuC-like enzyme